jgi:hypothetical protein
MSTPCRHISNAKCEYENCPDFIPHSFTFFCKNPTPLYWDADSRKWMSCKGNTKMDDILNSIYVMKELTKKH